MPRTTALYHRTERHGATADRQGASSSVLPRASADGAVSSIRTGIGTGQRPCAGPDAYKSRRLRPPRIVSVMNKLIRVLVVDDEARVRQGLRMRLALEPDLEVVGEARDGAEALHLALTLRPDIVVIDLLMPVMDGLQAIRLLRTSVPDSRVLAFSTRDEMSARHEAASAGAATFVAKQEGPDRLLAAIRDIVQRPSRHGAASE